MTHQIQCRFPGDTDHWVPALPDDQNAIDAMLPLDAREERERLSTFTDLSEAEDIAMLQREEWPGLEFRILSSGDGTFYVTDEPAEDERDGSFLDFDLTDGCSL